jgi:N-acyl-D-aspartate/D-glutamate deacylase
MAGGVLPLAMLWLPGPAVPATALALDADVLLRGGTIYDGSGAEGVAGDVAIRDGRIVALGRFDVGKVGRSIDCAGLVVAPGFIDLHTHSDGIVDKPETRANLNYLTQGCTTVVTGNCGGGKLKVAEFFDKIDREGAGTNVAHLVPHGAVRRQVMGGADRAPTAEELEQMRQLVDTGMREGACGISTGLIYPPGTFAQTPELVELAKVVAAHGGIYVSHIRDEGDELLDAVREAISIGRSAGLPVHISHFKAVGKSNWGGVRDAARLIDEARQDGLRVTADQYPYVATSTSLSATLFPATKIPGGLVDLAKRMEADPELLRSVRTVIDDRLAASSRVAVASCKKYPQWVGKGLRQIAAEENLDVIDLVLLIQFNGGASVVKFCLDEKDVRWVMGLDWVATGSDGGARAIDPGQCPHPRNFGTFPRKIGRYALAENVISLAHAIRSSSGLPADILGLSDRGYLKPEAHADVVVFDPKTLIDRATFDDPQQYSAGVRYLFVGGEPVIDDGERTGAFPGRAIRHKSK